MKKFRIKGRTKKICWMITIILLVIGLVMLIFLFFVDNKSEKGADLKLGILGDNGVELVSISTDRKMINVLDLNGEVKLWIPGGLGWYRDSIIKKVLTQEKKINLVDDILFYNFGFKADKILVLKNKADWKKRYWLKYRLASNKMLIKEETINKDMATQDDFLSEIMVRDFAETNLVNEELKLSVFNLSEVNGLASFMSKRLEWMGFSVVSIENITDDNIKKCLVNFGPKVRESNSWNYINELFDCDKKYDANLNDFEVEFYFDDNFSSVIKYPSYK